MRLLAVALALALPKHGVLAPGVSLGGLRLGMTRAQVRAAWGTGFGRCRGCPRTTWYFTYRPFEQRGAGVEFRAGRVVAVYTLWSPPGWRTTKGLRIGEPTARATALYGGLGRTECGTYSALVLPGRPAVSVVYLVGERVWGFGLLSPRLPACR